MADENINDSTISESTTDESTTSDSITSESTTDESTTDESITSESTTNDSTTSESTTDDSTSESTTDDSTTSDSITNESKTEDLVEKIIAKVKNLSIDQQRFVLRQLQKFEYMDRRQYKRYKCENLVIKFDVEGNQAKVHVHDISEGGAFVKTDMPVIVGQKANLTFEDMDKRTQSRVNSTIVRAVSDGVAVTFDADNKHQKLKLKSIMNYVRHVGYLLEE